jgi:hypothetical protein
MREAARDAIAAAGGGDASRRTAEARRVVVRVARCDA